MGFFNFAKAIEQSLYDVMMWVFFYPYTLFRMILFPSSTMGFVREETDRDPNSAFSSAMQPAIFLFISIAIGAIMAPLTSSELTVVEGSDVGRLVAGSWFALLLYRTVIFAFFALVGAALSDMLTPGRLSRETMRAPFHQQCYICAPFALIVSPTMVDFASGIDAAGMIPLAAVTLWFILCQYLFFRRFAGQSIVLSALLAPAVLIIGAIGAAMFAVPFL